MCRPLARCPKQPVCVILKPVPAGAHPRHSRKGLREKDECPCIPNDGAHDTASHIYAGNRQWHRASAPTTGVSTGRPCKPCPATGLLRSPRWQEHWVPRVVCPVSRQARSAEWRLPTWRHHRRHAAGGRTGLPRNAPGMERVATRRAYIESLFCPTVVRDSNAGNARLRLASPSASTPRTC